MYIPNYEILKELGQVFVTVLGQENEKFNIKNVLMRTKYSSILG